MSEEDRLLKAACKIEDCKRKDLLASRVTDKEVILIVGPVGFKRRYPVADLMPENYEDVAEDSEPPATFEGLVGPRIWGILVEAKLTDPAALGEKTNTALEDVPGLGRASVKEIREALDQLG
jgi:hypothetical protein